MAYTAFLLFFWLIFLSIGHSRLVFATTNSRAFYQTHRNTSIVSNDVIQELQTRTELACVSECRLRCPCLSVNVAKRHATLFRCTMFSVTAIDDGAFLKEEQGVSYIGFHHEKEKDEDCESKRNAGCRSSGVYTLARKSGEKITTYCDMQTGIGTESGGGWTMLQRRINGSVDFYRGWQEYKDGFGDPHGQFWIGLEIIHNLTKSGDFTLRVDLWDATEHRFSEFRNFVVANETDNYRLTYGSYSGTAGDSIEAESG